MSGLSEPSVHHAAAAEHHRQAARCHREALRHYKIGKDYCHKMPHYLNRVANGALAEPAVLNVSEHHGIAAGHHDAAGEHHAHADRNRDAEHFVRACYATKEALKHGEHALFHASRAAMHHTVHYGSHPSAELA